MISPSKTGSRIFLTGVLFLLITILLIAQPGTGGNPGGGAGQGGNPGSGGQGGNSGGGGQGDPCSRPNPPPNCAQPAPIEGILILILGGLAIGTYFTLKNHRNSGITKG